MANRYDTILMKARLDMTDQTVDTHVTSFTFTRPVLVSAVKIIPKLPLDTDGDTVAVDVSYSTDGFSSSDVEVAALAATEFNDTDNDIGTIRTSVDVPLTTASADDGIGQVRIPADAVTEITITATGASADGIVEVEVIGVVI